MQRVPKIPTSPPIDQVQKPNARVLIIARDSVIAALLGMLLELDGYEPVFPAPAETADHALARLRAPIVICADCDLPDLQSDLFFARVSKSNARIVLFGSPGSETRLKAMAAERSVRYFLLPTDRATLAHTLEEALVEIHAASGRDR